MDAVILYIDDTRADIELLRALIEPAGVTVESARSGASGIAAYDPARHDAVIIDWNLPDMEGWQVAEALLRRYPRCPIAFLSGIREEESVSLAASIGVARFFEKALTMEHIERVRVFANESAKASLRQVG